MLLPLLFIYITRFLSMLLLQFNLHDCMLPPLSSLAAKPHELLLYSHIFLCSTANRPNFQTKALHSGSSDQREEAAIMLWARSSLASRLSKAVQSQVNTGTRGGLTMESWEIEGPVLEWENEAAMQLAKLRSRRESLDKMAQEDKVTVVSLYMGICIYVHTCMHTHIYCMAISSRR
jgi:hypothetical protein